MNERIQLLDTVRQAREGRLDRRNAPFGEHVMRIPEQDFYMLLRLFPNLNSRKADEQKAEWERFFAHDLSIPYRVARTPVQVQRAPRRFRT